MTLPDVVTENDLDDIQSVDFDIGTLINRFIAPIEAKRSFSSVLPTTRPKRFDQTDCVDSAAEVLNTAVVDIEPQESRAHAFYRMISFPVLDINGGFYNPGFNPGRSLDACSQNVTIANNPFPNIDKMHAERETSARKQISLFTANFLDASILSLAMQRVKPFQVIDESKSSIEFDAQQFTVAERKTFLNERYTAYDGNDLTKFFEQGSHLIRPILVSPALEHAVQPRNRKVCEPFLATKNDAQIDEGVFLDRPGIEFILRLRLRQQPDKDALEETLFTLDPNVGLEGISLADLSRLALALLDEEKINPDDILQKIGLPDLELININKLVKLIKACVDELANAVETIDRVSRVIDWTPLPGENGPQDSSNISVDRSLVIPRQATSELERRIVQLSIKKSNAERTGRISDNDEIANSRFAISYFENTEQLFEKELNQSEQERDEDIRAASAALSKIEVITGEVSGFGLVDILAVYTALWAIDLDVLVSLLDENAFQRLVDNNVDLKKASVQTRVNLGHPVFGIFEALQQFETKVINILSWADKLFEQKQTRPNTEEGGQLP